MRPAAPAGRRRTLTALTWALVILFALFGAACLLMVVLGLPGTWLLLAVAAAVELIDAQLAGAAGAVAVQTFGWRLLGGCALLGLLGEGLEFVSRAAGARLGGSSRRGMWGALIGGPVGAIALTPVIPIPLLGTLLGALLGTFVGAFVAEATSPEARRRGDTARAALAAVLGHLAGILGKLAVGVAVWILLLRALIVP